MMTVDDVLAMMSVPQGKRVKSDVPVKLRVDSFERVTGTFGVARDVHLWVGVAQQWTSVGMALNCTDDAQDHAGRWQGSEIAVYWAFLTAAGIRVTSNQGDLSGFVPTADAIVGIDLKKLGGLLPHVACRAVHFDESFNPVTGRFESVSVYLDGQSTASCVFSRDSSGMTFDYSDILKQVVRQLGLVSDVELAFSEDLYDSQDWSASVTEFDAWEADVHAASMVFKQVA